MSLVACAVLGGEPQPYHKQNHGPNPGHGPTQGQPGNAPQAQMYNQGYQYHPNYGGQQTGLNIIGARPCPTETNNQVYSGVSTQGFPTLSPSTGQVQSQQGKSPGMLTSEGEFHQHPILNTYQQWKQPPPLDVGRDGQGRQTGNYEQPYQQHGPGIQPQPSDVGRDGQGRQTGNFERPYQQHGPGIQPQPSDVGRDGQGRQTGNYEQPYQQHGPGIQPQPSDVGRDGQGRQTGNYEQPYQQHGPGIQPPPSDVRRDGQGRQICNYGQPYQQHGPGIQPSPSDVRRDWQGRQTGNFGQPFQQHGPGIQPPPLDVGRDGQERQTGSYGQPYQQHGPEIQPPPSDVRRDGQGRQTGNFGQPFQQHGPGIQPPPLDVGRDGQEKQTGSYGQPYQQHGPEIQPPPSDVRRDGQGRQTGNFGQPFQQHGPGIQPPPLDVGRDGQGRQTGNYGQPYQQHGPGIQPSPSYVRRDGQGRQTGNFGQPYQQHGQGIQPPPSDVRRDGHRRQTEELLSCPGNYGHPYQQHGSVMQPQHSDGRRYLNVKQDGQGRQGQGPPLGSGNYGQPYQQYGQGTQPQYSDSRSWSYVKPDWQGRQSEGISGSGSLGQPYQQYGTGMQPQPSEGESYINVKDAGYYGYSYHEQMQEQEGMHFMPQIPNTFPPEFAPSMGGGTPGTFLNVKTATAEEKSDEEDEEETEELGIIKVTELSSKTTEETLTRFFENRKKTGGGKIKVMDFRKKSSTAVITFKDPAAVKRVLQKLPLLLEKKRIKVERFFPDNDSSEEETSGEEENKPSCTIEVRGIKGTTSVDQIELYFESKKATGESVEIQKFDDSERKNGVIYITYKTQQVVKAVLERKHKLDGANLNIRRFSSLPPSIQVVPCSWYPDKVLIRGKNPNTSPEGLENFLQAKANVTPIHFLPGEEEDTVLVTFEEPPDFDKMEKACSSKQLDHCFLKVSKVPISNCILVKGTGEKTTQSALEYYFDNPGRSGGGDVREIKDLGDGSYLVYFKDHTVIDRVCGRSHTVDNQTLDVKLYHELIGDPGEDGPRFKVPDALIITDLDSRKVQFVQYSPPNKNDLEKQLTALHTKIIWPEKLAEPVKLECLLTKDVKDCRTLAKAWKQTARTSLDKFLGVLFSFKHEILQDAWEDVIAQLGNINIPQPDAVKIVKENDSCEIFVTGHKEFTKEVDQSMKTIIKATIDELDRKKKQVKETTSAIKHHQVIMLSLEHFIDTTEKKYPGMKVTLDLKARTVTYEGLYGEVNSAKLEMFEIANAIVTLDVDNFNKGRFAYLQESAVKQYVEGKMKEEKIKSFWEMQDNRFVVYAMTDDAAVRAAHILKESVLETIVDIKEESSPLLTSDQWARKKQSIKDDCRIMTHMDVQEHQRRIVIYSTDRDAGFVREMVTDFLNSNTIYNTKLKISEATLQELRSSCLDEIMAIEKQHKADQVDVTIENNGIVIKGTEQGLSHAKMKIRPIIAVVEKLSCNKSKDYDKQVEPEIGTPQTPRRRDGIQEMGWCSQPDYRLMVMMGDITNLNVDVLVNAANKELQHDGGLAKAIVDKGGGIIQSDCDTHIKQHSRLLEGGVFLGKPGNLQCNFIAHAVCPVWQGGTNNEEEHLREAVQKSMEEANNKSQTSIALPALGAGIFGYPANKSTQTIVEAVGDFYGDNPGCCIRDVYLCDVNKKNVDLFMKAVAKKFGAGKVNVRCGSGGAEDKWSPPVVPGTCTHTQDSTTFSMFKGLADLFSKRPNNASLSIKLVKGHIAKQQVDVIVNTCSSDLKLNVGAVSSSLLTTAGPGLQKECNQSYPAGLKSGAIAITKGYSLQCQHVFHINLPRWDSGGSSLPVLQKFILDCLQEATKNKYQSIAFPAMGTGNLGYPRDLVAKEMFKIVTNYSTQNPSSSVNKVLFVIYDKDAPTIKAFEKAEEETKGKPR